MDGRMDGRMDGWTDGRMDGRTDGRDGWMDGWMCVCMYIYMLQYYALRCKTHVFETINTHMPSRLAFCSTWSTVRPSLLLKRWSW